MTRKEFFEWLDKCPTHKWDDKEMFENRWGFTTKKDALKFYGELRKNAKATV